MSNLESRLSDAEARARAMSGGLPRALDAAAREFETYLAGEAPPPPVVVELTPQEQAQVAESARRFDTYLARLIRAKQEGEHEQP